MEQEISNLSVKFFTIVIPIDVGIMNLVWQNIPLKRQTLQYTALDIKKLKNVVEQTLVQTY